MSMFRYSGRIHPDSTRHAPRTTPEDPILGVAPLLYDEWTGKFDIPQYAPTIKGKSIGYDPAHDCDGAFVLSKNQMDNNCYAYACCIATSTWPMPGRASKGSKDLSTPGNLTVDDVRNNACLDGLLPLGTSMPDPHHPPGPGHLVALLFAAPVPKWGYHGDFHFVRCDDPSRHTQWSQKDGGGQPTSYDFAGHPITDPRSANWVTMYAVREQVQVKISYVFDSFLWVSPRTHIV